jgi:hypothetical protein
MKFLMIHFNHAGLHAFILIGLGLLIRYVISRRRFNRRGIAGLQQFTSYEKWWLITRIEALFYFLGWLAIGTGIFLLIFK